MDDLGLPYKPKTRQEDGADTEKRILRGRGARQHPRSGAGRIKYDGSDDDDLIEVKDANKSHTLQASLLNDLFVTATRQGKDAVYIVTFLDPSLYVECRVRRHGPGKTQ